MSDKTHMPSKWYDDGELFDLSIIKSNAISNNNKIEELYNGVQDTLFIITADHGHIDVKGYIEFYNDLEINSLLSCPPYLDARTPAFIVKKGKEKLFEN